MKKLGLRFAVATVALAVLSGSVLAEEQKRKKKVSFFESLFSSSPSKKQREKKRSVFGKNWWEEEDDVRVIRGTDSSATRKKKTRQARISDTDPEGSLPGMGMGNLNYVPEKLTALGGAIFAMPRPASEMEGAVYDTLADKALGLNLRAEARDAIRAHYVAQDFRPIWIEDGKLSARANAVLKLLSEADAEGLTASNYLPSALASFDAALPAETPQALAALDVGLTAMAVRYARDASGGQFNPRRLSLYNDLVPAWVPADQALKVLAWSPFPAEYLTSLHPRHAAYAALKKALAERQTARTTLPPEPIPDGAIIKIGRTDARLPQIRARLAERGFAPPIDYIPEDPEVLDAELSGLLKEFQKSVSIKVSGLVGPQTIAALNHDEDAQVLPRLVNNMERLRWLPRDLGKRHVFVNQPAYAVSVMDGGQEIWQSRVIVGRPTTQTSAFHDEIETVVFNPSWGVPQSIIVNEYLPKLRDDPSYLDRMGFKVINQSGKVVRSSNVDWWSYGSEGSLGVQQPPGDSNALGELKFLFPNSHDIYMHDTPNRDLFENSQRAYSHGCVRVQNPRDFAAVLLGWDAEEVARNVESGKSQTVKLDQKVPVHLTYFTAWPDEFGKIQFFADIYGRDKAMNNARSAITLAQR